MQASTLQERIAAYRRGATFAPAEEWERRATRWAGLLNADDPRAFKERLSRLELTAADLPQILGNPKNRFCGALSGWGAILEEIVRAVGEKDRGSEPRSAENTHSADGLALELEKLYLPILRVARTRFRQKIDGKLDDGNVDVGFEQSLLRRLTVAGNKLVQIQFAVWQTMARLGLTQNRSAGSVRAETRAREFLGSVPGERLLYLFREHPVFARQCAVLAENWVTATAKFWRRLAKDRPELSRRFHGNCDVGNVVEIEAGLSDSHHGGESVVAVTFAHGMRLIYKPRSLAAERSFFALLASFGSTKRCGRFRTPKIWNRKTYGWMEYIAPTPCPDLPAVRRFYWRAGVMLGLVYLARGVDCHKGNLIAAGEQPILIDLDALWHPQNQRQSVGGSEANVRSSVTDDSILRTGFLPGGAVSEQMRYTASALEPARRQLPAGKTDNVAVTRARTGPPPRYTHLPVWNDTPVPASHYCSQILAGYRWIGKKFLLQRSDRTRLRKWLEALRRLPRRRIYRSTAIYYSLLERVSDPRVLRRGIDHSIELEALFNASSRTFCEDRELEDLLCFDVPYFLQPKSSDPRETKIRLPSLSRYWEEASAVGKSLASGEPAHQGSMVQ